MILKNVSIKKALKVIRSKKYDYINFYLKGNPYKYDVVFSEEKVKHKKKKDK